MRVSTECNKKFRDKLWIIIGIIGIGLYYLPYFILGQDASFRISDFLDDEVVQLLFNGKYLFASPDTIVEEWLSGVPFASIQAPCFLLVFFFKFLSFYHAILLISLFGVVCAYIGMYLLCDKLMMGERRYFSIMAALLFCMLPYYPSYGLSSVGLPLVVWASINLCEDKEGGKLRYLPYYLTILIYALSSSLIWAGYFVVGFTFVAMVILVVRKHKGSIRLLISGVMMTAVYCYVFRATIACVLFGTYTPHRSDEGRVYIAENFVDNFIEMFKYGQYHAPSLHTYIMAFSLVVILMGWIFYKRLNRKIRNKVWITSFIWMTALGIALFHAFYGSEIGYQLRGYMGGLESFQLDRVYWMYPMLWYAELALGAGLFFDIAQVALDMILDAWKALGRILTADIRRRILQIASAGFTVVVTVFFVYYITHHQNSVEYYANLQRLQNQETEHISYREFYDHELFDKVEDYIGRVQSEYRVGCIGFVPAIASVNGFYTVDGYSTNYPLDYKREFREVIAGELDKSAVLKQYYDDWGSRCYLFSAELGLDYDIRKNENITIQNLQIDTEKLKDFGCEYIFSAVEIENASDINMELLEVFEGEAIELFVYRLI